MNKPLQFWVMWGSAAAAVGIGISALAGCASNPTTTTVNPGSNPVPTAFPPFISMCDNGNRLYYVSMANGDPDIVFGLKDASCTGQ